MNIPPAGEGEEEWQKELVNGSQNIMLKGLKGGLSYRVRLAVRGHHDQLLHLSEDFLIAVPGEAVLGRSPPPWSGPCLPLHCVKCVVVRAVM